MKFSAFAPLGMFSFSNRPTRAESHYKSLVSLYRTAFAVDSGDFLDAMCYAVAKAWARAMYTVERAGNQVWPEKAQDLINLLEHDYMVPARPRLPTYRRAAAVYAVAAATRGARTESATDALSAALGEAFVAFVPAKVLGAPANVSWVGASHNAGNAPPKVGIITTPVARAGTWTVEFQAFVGNDVVKAGDVLVVDGGNDTREEKITVSAATATTITADFARPHDGGAAYTSGNWLASMTTLRTSYVVVTTPASHETARVARTVMRRVSRAVDAIEVVGESAPGMIGPFYPHSLMGTTTLGQVARQ